MKNYWYLTSDFFNWLKFKLAMNIMMVNSARHLRKENQYVEKVRAMNSELIWKADP